MKGFINPQQQRAKNERFERFRRRQRVVASLRNFFNTSAAIAGVLVISLGLGAYIAYRTGESYEQYQQKMELIKEYPRTPEQTRASFLASVEILTGSRDDGNFFDRAKAMERLRTILKNRNKYTHLTSEIITDAEHRLERQITEIRRNPSKRPEVDSKQIKNREEIIELINSVKGANIHEQLERSR